MVAKESTVSRIANSKTVQTLALALGVAILAEIMAPAITRATKPMFRNLVKDAVKMSEELKVKTEETKETLEDIVAEAKEEYKAEKAKAAKGG